MPEITNTTSPPHHRVRRRNRTSGKTPPWQEPFAKDAPAERLDNFLGGSPDHFPKTEVWMVYDRRTITVMFRVEDRYVRATADRHQESVCRDSCVEFFFTPGPDIEKGYFNLEINCGGTILFHYHPRPERHPFIELPASVCDGLECRHSLPKIVDPEIVTPTTWHVAVDLQVDTLADYLRPVAPAPGVVWRANFYKCADATSHPHWLSWAPVEAPKPDFHLPRFFGFLEFE